MLVRLLPEGERRLLLRRQRLGLRLGRLGLWRRRARLRHRRVGRLDVDSHEHAHHLQHALVLQVLADGGRVALQALDLGDEAGVGEECCRLRVRRDLLQHVRLPKHIAERAHPAVVLRRLHLGLGLGHAVGQHREPRLVPEPRLVRRYRVVVPPEAVQRSALPPVALAPVGLGGDALLRIGERLVVLPQAAVARRPVRVEHVRRLDVESLGEVLDGGREVCCLELLVAERLLRLHI
mmetsp:Transcript_30315/g.90067  ORF Transcript_30315/g.90067 Transcript_30315/m.90067 type:complete len:236 (+) Transcript_30315:1309-2016(+)